MILLSEKYGRIIPGESPDGVSATWDVYDQQEYSASIITIRFAGDDLVTFSAVPWPYTLIYIFGYSTTLYLARSSKKEIHDRGSHLFHTSKFSFDIRIKGQREFIIYSIHYSPHFVQNSLDETAQSARMRWELFSPVFYYTRAKIVKREMMDILSIFLRKEVLSLETTFIKDELARTILLHFLQEYGSSFQPSHLRAADFELFYIQRDRLVKEALYSRPMTELLFRSGIKHVSLFRKRLRQLYDLNIREFIIEIRMTVAMSLLKDPTLSIKQIAGKIGFTNAFYFSRVFSKYFGAPPRDFHDK